MEDTETLRQYKSMCAWNKFIESENRPSRCFPGPNDEKLIRCTSDRLSYRRASDWLSWSPIRGLRGVDLSSLRREVMKEQMELRKQKEELKKEKKELKRLKKEKKELKRLKKEKKELKKLKKEKKELKKLKKEKKERKRIMKELKGTETAETMTILEVKDDGNGNAEEMKIDVDEERRHQVGHLMQEGLKLCTTEAQTKNLASSSKDA